MIRRWLKRLWARLVAATPYEVTQADIERLRRRNDSSW